jgi:hypothetical protein
MSIPREQVIHTITRTLIVAAATIALGFILHGSLIFIPTMVAFQFTFSGITAGVFYGFAKTASLRNAIAAAFVWYLASTLRDVHNSWLFILSLVYVAGISGAVYIYMLLIKRRVFNGIIQRVATITLLTAIINALLILVLMAITAPSRSVDAQTVSGLAQGNFQIGILIGLGIGLGIEIAEYILGLKSFQHIDESAQEVQTPANNRPHDARSPG